MFFEKEDVLFEKNNFKNYSRLIHNVFFPEPSISSSHSIKSPAFLFSSSAIGAGNVVDNELLFCVSFVFLLICIPPFLDFV